MIHSLASINYLKIETGNMVFFDSMDPNNTYLHIQQQHNDNNNNSSYEDIFKIKLQAMELQDLILI